VFARSVSLSFSLIFCLLSFSSWFASILFLLRVSLFLFFLACFQTFILLFSLSYSLSYSLCSVFLPSSIFYLASIYFSPISQCSISLSSLSSFSSQVDELMPLATCISWLPEARAEAPADYVQDLLSYLQTAFVCMQNMPEGFRQAIHFTTCKHIADTYMVCVWGRGCVCVSWRGRCKEEREVQENMHFMYFCQHLSITLFHRISFVVSHSISFPHTRYVSLFLTPSFPSSPSIPVPIASKRSPPPPFRSSTLSHYTHSTSTSLVITRTRTLTQTLKHADLDDANPIPVVQ
jgi:hypothetical protein